MAFVQIIDTRTSKIDEVQALEAEWKKATEGKRTLRRSIVARDRNDPSRHLIFAFFDSYESAMENSKLPETQAFAEKLAALYSEAPTFQDLDIIDDWS